MADASITPMLSSRKGVSSALDEMPQRRGKWTPDEQNYAELLIQFERRALSARRDRAADPPPPLA